MVGHWKDGILGMFSCRLYYIQCQGIHRDLKQT